MTHVADYKLLASLPSIHMPAIFGFDPPTVDDDPCFNPVANEATRITHHFSIIERN